MRPPSPLPRVRSPVLVLLAALLLAPLLPGEDAGAGSGRARHEPAPRWISLAGARVLASPGTPEALVPFLPKARPPERLALPLPDGPVLVLGLPREDPAAAELAWTYGLLSPIENLDGGFVVAAWNDGRRPIALILADDPVALAAARFQLDEEGAPSGSGPEVDLRRRPAEDVRRIAAGVLRFRPRYRVRALDPVGATDLGEVVASAIGGHASQVWLDPSAFPPEALARALARLSRWGIEGVLLAPPEGTAPDAPEAVAFQRARARFPALAVGRRPPRGRDGRPAGVARLVGSDGPEDATPLRYETWALDADGRELPPWVLPSRPRDEPDTPRGRNDRIVLAGNRWASLLLEDAWTRPSTRGGTPGREEWEDVLLPLLPRGARDARAFLREASRALEDAARRSLDAVPWLGALGRRLGRAAEEAPPDALLVPRSPLPVSADDRLDEPAWRWAASVPLRGRAAGEAAPVLLLLADGRRLAVGIRWPGTPTPLAVSLRPSDEGGRAVARTREPGPTGSAEILFGHVDLQGDAHPGRILELTVEAGRPRQVLIRRTLVLGS